MKFSLLSATAIATVMIATAPGAQAQAISAEEAQQLRAQIALLKAQVSLLESRLDSIAPSTAGGVAAASSAPVSGSASAPIALAAASTDAPKPESKIGWKGSPQITLGDLSFKVKGRIQLDAGYVAAPKSVADKGMGFSNEARRIRLGGEGTLGGGFGYKLETELSDNAIDLVDTYISYTKGKWLLQLGNQNGFQSLDELTGDTSGSVMERAAFTDAFGFERRLGLSVQYRSGPWLAQAAIMSDSVDSLTNANDGVNGGDENDSYGLDGRLVFAPKIGETQFHLAGSYHWRDFNRLSDAPQRYRQRPYLHTSNSRFLSTPAISAESESHYGVEAAAIRGPLWFAGEAHWLRASRPGLADPLFFGAYAEAGLFLTKGDTRVYGKGIFGIPEAKTPLGKGGIGAVQVTLRYDYLNMNSAGIIGGTQNAYIAALVWTPITYLRFNMNYAHVAYTDAAILAGTRSDYAINVLGLRAELDF